MPKEDESVMCRELRIGDFKPYQHADDWDQRDNLTYPPETEQKASEHLDVSLDDSNVRKMIKLRSAGSATSSNSSFEG